MIHHISIPAADPEHVARVIVDLFDGTLARFGPNHGSWIAWATDDAGTAVEIYPTGTELYPPIGPGQARFRQNPSASKFTATHTTISLARPASEILSVAEREGWRAELLSRGPHDVIEFWIENHVMLELMTPDMTTDYLGAAPTRH